MANYYIVGGNSGIGFELGKTLLEEGHQVYQASREQGALLELGAKWQQLDGSLEIPENLDGLVYCPGTIRLKPFHRITAEEFQEDMEVNAFGAVRVLQAARKSLQAGDGGSVVLFSSVAASLGLSYHASIAMAKAAVEGLTKSLAAEWAPKVRVNAIAPSLTKTPLAENLTNTEQKVEASAARHPLKTIGDPKDIAKLAHYLLSENAAFVTGQIYHADGGIGSLRV